MNKTLLLLCVEMFPYAQGGGADLGCLTHLIAVALTNASSALLSAAGEKTGKLDTSPFPHAKMLLHTLCMTVRIWG